MNEIQIGIEWKKKKKRNANLSSVQFVSLLEAYRKWLKCNFSRVGFTLSYYSLNKQTGNGFYICMQSIIEPYRITYGGGWLPEFFVRLKYTSLSVSGFQSTHSLFFWLLLCLPSSSCNTVFDKFGVTQIVTEAHHYAPVSCCLTFEFRSHRYK